MRRLSIVAAALLATATLVFGCRNAREAERREADKATASAEENARESTLTCATLEPSAPDARANDEAALRARNEVIAAFRLEQADFRNRLQHALEALDTEILRARRASRRNEARLADLRARRDLLKSDLEAVNRSIEPDWATLRTKVDRDLETGRPGAQLPPLQGGPLR